MADEHSAGERKDVGQKIQSGVVAPKVDEAREEQLRLDRAEKREREEKQAKEAERLKEDKRARAHTALAIGEFAIGLALFFVVRSQTEIFTRQTDIQDSQVSIAANQTRISAKQLDAQIAGERAWLLPDDSNLDNPSTKEIEGNVAEKSSITVYIRNFGQGAAFDVTYKPYPTKAGQFENGIRPDDTTIEPDKGAVMLPPDRLMPLRYYFADGRKKGSREIVYFVVKYWDQFKLRVRTTRFCVQAAFDYRPRDRSVAFEQGCASAD